PDMAKVCNRRKILWIPGCGSLSEIGMAEELGAEIVKIFPGGSVGGPDFVKSVKAPCPWTSLMPSGGVSTTEENLKQWFDAGAACVGIGSKLFPKQAIAEGKFDGIKDEVKKVLSIIEKIRN